MLTRVLGCMYAVATATGYAHAVPARVFAAHIKNSNHNGYRRVLSPSNTIRPYVYYFDRFPAANNLGGFNPNIVKPPSSMMNVPYQDKDKISDISGSPNLIQVDGFRQLLEQGPLNDFQVHYPALASTAEVKGDQYIFKTILPGFNAKEITVKAHKGFLTFIAEHKAEDGSNKMFEDMRPIPIQVNTTGGDWTYDGLMLTVTFPIKKVSTDTSHMTENVTQVSVKIKEEKKNNGLTLEELEEILGSSPILDSLS